MPGPGRYNPISSDTESMRSSKKTNMGKGLRAGSSYYDGLHLLNPSPDTYRVSSRLGEKPTMVKMKNQMGRRTPGGPFTEKRKAL